MNLRPPIPLRLNAGLLAPLAIGCQLATGAMVDPSADRDALPAVPPGFEVSFFAREPEQWLRRGA